MKMTLDFTFTISTINLKALTLAFYFTFTASTVNLKARKMTFYLLGNKDVCKQVNS